MDWRKTDSLSYSENGRAVYKGRGGQQSAAHKGNLVRTRKAGQTRPTSLRGIATKATTPFAEASLSEEPGAGKLHAGICAGGVRQLAGLPRWRFHRG